MKFGMNLLRFPPNFPAPTSASEAIVLTELLERMRCFRLSPDDSWDSSPPLEGYGFGEKISGTTGVCETRFFSVFVGGRG